MSLLDSLFEDCTMIDKTSTADGYGGTKTAWVDGAKFRSAITLDTSTQARIASQQGVNNLYTVTTKQNTNLQYHDVFRRESDKKIFRVTSDGDDKHTPSMATLNMRQVSAEEWKLPNDKSTSDS